MPPYYDVSSDGRPTMTTPFDGEPRPGLLNAVRRYLGLGGYHTRIENVGLSRVPLYALLQSDPDESGCDRQ